MWATGLCALLIRTDKGTRDKRGHVAELLPLRYGMHGWAGHGPSSEIFKRDPAAPPRHLAYSIIEQPPRHHSAASDSDTQVAKDEVFHVKETRVHETPANSPMLPCPSYVLTEAAKSRHPQVERVLLQTSFPKRHGGAHWAVWWHGESREIRAWLPYFMGNTPTRDCQVT